MSSLRSQEIEAIAGDPFENCRLDRKKYAEVLTNIIKTYEDGFVLGLNNKWGEGKTTFIRMWRLYLGQSERGFKTLYFNAWEHDFNHDALSAILSELKSLEIYDKQEFAPLLKKGAKLTKSLIPVFISAVAEKVVDTKKLNEAFQKLSEEAASIFEEEVNEYSDKKKGLEDFKTELESYISKLEKKPLVFFIDELDRCNPKYAVEFLEVVKHFFSVPGIVFVISIDKEQLSHSIKGYFGSENLNTEEYLRRFIDLEFSIPSPELGDYIDYVFQKSGISEFLRNDNRRLDKSLNNESNLIHDLANSYFHNSKISLRQIEKIINHTSIVLKTFHIRSSVFPVALFTIILIKFTNENLYNKIKTKDLEFQEFINSISPYINLKVEFRKLLNISYIETSLIYFYCKERSGLPKNMFDLNSDQFKTNLESRITDETGFYSIDLDDRLKRFHENNDYSEIDWHTIISRIELLNSLRGY